MKKFLIIVACSVAAWPAHAVEVIAEVETDAAEDASVLVGEWPDKTISLDIKDGEVREAVEAIADQAGWGLVFTASEDQADRRITLRIKDVAAAEALEVVLEGSGLQARLKKNILVITPIGGGDEEQEVTRVKMPLGDIEVDVKQGEKHRIIHHGPDERTAIGGNLVIEPGEHVDGDAVAVGGNLTVSEGATVDGDAVAVGGSVLVKSGAHVDGEAVAVGGEVTVEDGATVDGDRVSVGGSFGGLIATLVGMGIERPGIPSYLLTLLMAVVRVIALLVLGLLVLTFAPERVGNARAFLAERPGHSVLAGLAILIGFIPLCILLGITVIGIPLIPIAAIILAAAMVLGLTAFCTWLGERIPIFVGKKTPIGALLVGLAVVFLVDLVPLIGSTAVVVVAFISAGAVLLSRFGKRTPAPEMPKDVAEAI